MKIRSVIAVSDTFGLPLRVNTAMAPHLQSICLKKSLTRLGDKLVGQAVTGKNPSPASHLKVNTLAH